MSFLEFMGIAFIGILVDEYVRYSMEETSIFSHKKAIKQIRTTIITHRN